MLHVTVEEIKLRNCQENNNQRHFSCNIEAMQIDITGLNI